MTQLVLGQADGWGGALAELAWPTRCAGCNLPGALLCPDCRRTLPWIEQRLACPMCGAPGGWLTCTECDRSRGAAPDAAPDVANVPLSQTKPSSWLVRTTVCSLPFAGVGAQMATLLKDGHELRLAPVIAAAMATSLDEASSWEAPDGRPRFDALRTDALCFVPASPAAYARRGFDHMELVSRALSGFLGIPLHDCLARVDTRDQRLLGKEARAKNLAGSVCATHDVRGLNLLLADDVVTTGSSVNEAARVLLERGAASVTACALCRVC